MNIQDAELLQVFQKTENMLSAHTGQWDAVPEAVTAFLQSKQKTEAKLFARKHLIQA